MRVVSRIGSVDKRKNSAAPRSSGRILELEMKKWHPLFFQDLGPWLQESIPPLPHESLFFEMRCSRFKTEKSPSPQILRSRIMDRYSGVLTLWYFLKNAGYQLLASTSHQIPALSKQLGRFGQRIQALPSTWLQRKYLPVDLLQFSLWYVIGTPFGQMTASNCES